MEDNVPVKTKMERRAEKHGKKVSDMVTCPLCNAMSYPKVEVVNGVATLFCKSCNSNMTEMFEAIKEWQANYLKHIKEEEAKAKAEEEANGGIDLYTGGDQNGNLGEDHTEGIVVRGVQE